MTRISIAAILLTLPLLAACGGGGGGDDGPSGLLIVQDHETLPPRATSAVAIYGGTTTADYATTWTAQRDGILERLALFIAAETDADEPFLTFELWSTDATGKPATDDPTRQLATFEVRIDRLSRNFFYIPYELRERNIPIRAGMTYAIVVPRGTASRADVRWFGDPDVDTPGGATWRRESGDWFVQEQEDLAMRVLLEIGG